MWHLNQLSSETLKWYKDTFLVSISKSVQNSSIKKSVKEILLPKGSSYVIEQLLLSPPERLYPLNVRLEKKIKAKGNEDVSRKKILKAFNYDGRISRNKAVAYELAERIGTRTCVYCNRVYAFTVESEGGIEISRPDFDHWLPKDKHPLLSMSIYNLIPSCPICNRGIKLRHEFKYGSHVHPYNSNEEMKARFQYAPLIGGKWKLTFSGGTKEENATASILKIEEVYGPFANSEVKDILDFAYANPPEYLIDLKEKVMKAYNGTISKEHAYRLVFGTEMRASLFSDRPLSKMKRDILKQLQDALKINLIDF
jgi:hypothetical protein